MKTGRKKILVICPHPQNVAPGQRLKYEQYFDYFREHGYEITVAPFMHERFWKVVYQRGHYLTKILWTLYGYLIRCYDLLLVPFYDGLYIFLWVVPFGPPIFERLYCLLNNQVIYDIDDLVFLKPKSEGNPFVAFLKSKSRIIYLMKKARHVITCTPTLDNFARQYNPNTTDISSTINTDAYLPTNDYSNHRTITLGWSGSHSTVKYLYLLEKVLLDLNREVPLKLLVIGDTNFRIEGLDVTAIAWQEQSEIDDLRRIDIGLYPLPDEEWVLGKSGLKALQYMALGIPTVATAIGANFRVIEDGVSGFLVNTEAEWKDRLKLLIESPELRRDIGQQGRQRVKELYSVQANRGQYLNILDSVINRGDR